MTNGTQNMSTLFQGAVEEGTLTAGAAAVLDVPDLGVRIQAGMGIDVDDVEASEVVLLAQLIDDSGSIRFSGNTNAVREGHNGVLDALGKAKKKDGVLAHTRYLNGKVLFPYSTLDNAVRMDSGNYNPNGGTPLYDETVTLLGTVLAKQQEFAANGVPCRCVTLITTDGRDEGSNRQSAASVAKVVRSMLATESHIIAAMGIEDNQGTDFRRIFLEMGIPEEWILISSSDPKEIRQKFDLVSQTAVRASQGAAGFSQAAMGGFNTP